MKPFAYRTADSVAEAVRLVEPLGRAGQGGAFLAGGTTVVDLMKLGVLAPPSLTDIGRVGLEAIEVEGDRLHLGARVRMAEAARHPALARGAPVLSQALWKAASPQLRNVATLAGNVLQRTRCPYFRDTASPCNKRVPGSGCAAIGGIDRTLAVLGTSESCIANYPGDFANALLLFDTTVETEGRGGGREIAFDSLHRPPGDHPERETVLDDDELIVGFRLTVPSWARRSRYVKVRERESYAFALTSAAVALRLEDDNVADVRLAIGGAASIPWRAREAEAFLTGRPLSEAAAMEAGRIAFSGARAGTHNGFKIPLGERTVARALLEVGALDLADTQGAQ